MFFNINSYTQSLRRNSGVIGFYEMLLLSILSMERLHVDRNRVII